MTDAYLDDCERSAVLAIRLGAMMGPERVRDLVAEVRRLRAEVAGLKEHARTHPVEAWERRA